MLNERAFKSRRNKVFKKVIENGSGQSRNGATLKLLGDNTRLNIITLLTRRNLYVWKT